jgi:hypothetical protein
VCSVRDEEVVGSNPATPTQVRALLRSWLGLYWLSVQQSSSYMGPSRHIGRARPSTGCKPDGVQQQPHPTDTTSLCYVDTSISNRL